MNKRQLYEQIMLNVSNEVKKVLNEEYMTNDEILNHYGITVFQMNENLGVNLQKYKAGVVNAIKKLKQQIGDKAGYVIKNIIESAKKTNVKTLIMVLTMLCTFAGNANAEMTNTAAKGFADDCAKYCNNDQTLNNGGEKFDTFMNLRMTEYEAMYKDSDFIYYTGYGQGNNFKEAKSIALRAALSRLKEDGKQVDVSRVFATTYLTGANSNQCIVIIKVLDAK